MLTDLDPKYTDSDLAQSATEIIKKCVHRGFCNATCPTFIEIGDQNTGPRGRIYLIRAFLEGRELTKEEREQLDLCLVCRSCQTTCPASVEFGRLITIARTMMEQETPRPWKERALRSSMRQILPYQSRFSVALTMGRLFKPLLPEVIAEKIPAKEKTILTLAQEPQSSERYVIMLKGCAQPSMTPNTNIAAINVLSKLGIRVKEVDGCCGAIDLGLGKMEKAKHKMKCNIDAWWSEIENGAEAIISLSSACELMLTEYSKYLEHDDQYAKKAEQLSGLVKNMGEILQEEDLTQLNIAKSKESIALHTPCSLRHGLEKNEIPEEILQKLGIKMTKTEDNHICCGSGGTYSLLQSKMSQKLLQNKITALTLDSPSLILTSNASCQCHIGTKSPVPVRHWIELVHSLLEEKE